jgi:hypothetical protein
MVSILSELELCSIDHMPRQELVDAVRARADDLPVDLLGQLEEQPTHHLRLLLLAGRLIRVLRHVRKHAAATLGADSRWEVRD